MQITAHISDSWSPKWWLVAQGWSCSRYDIHSGSSFHMIFFFFCVHWYWRSAWTSLIIMTTTSHYHHQPQPQPSQPFRMMGGEVGWTFLIIMTTTNHNHHQPPPQPSQPFRMIGGRGGGNFLEEHMQVWNWWIIEVKYQVTLRKLHPKPSWDHHATLNSVPPPHCVVINKIFYGSGRAILKLSELILKSSIHCVRAKGKSICLTCGKRKSSSTGAKSIRVYVQYMSKIHLFDVREMEVIIHWCKID